MYKLTWKDVLFVAIGYIVVFGLFGALMAWFTKELILSFGVAAFIGICCGIGAIRDEIKYGKMEKQRSWKEMNNGWYNAD